MEDLQFEISGLKCDNVECDYRDDSVEFKDYFASINKPCPKCGHCLLTEKEYNNCLRMYKTVEVFKKMGNIFKWINPMHYWRLIFGDGRDTVTITKKFH